MTDTLLRQLESLIGTDDFEFVSEEIFEKLENEGAGFEIVNDLIGIMERHPLDDLGMPGPVVHFIERFYPDYLPALVDSVKRAPSMHTVWMLNRCINGTKDKTELVAVLRSVVDNDDADELVRDAARGFLDYQQD